MPPITLTDKDELGSISQLSYFPPKLDLSHEMKILFQFLWNFYSRCQNALFPKQDSYTALQCFKLISDLVYIVIFIVIDIKYVLSLHELDQHDVKPTSK